MKKPRRIPTDEIILASNLGREGRLLEEIEVIQLLRMEIEREGHQGAFASRHGLSRTYVNRILNRKQPIPDSLLKALKLRKVYAPE